MAKKKLQKLDEDFYLNEVGVMDWLTNNENQKVIFTNRFEYRENNLLHREDGPAIEFHSGGGIYYIKGQKYSDDEYTNYRRTKLIDEML